jgi:AraC family transcriptional regulator of adaptative response / DNA-3-methyladenine glycosylase II
MEANRTHTLTDDELYRAAQSRDPRFDGVFFVGVTTTGIYCRPVCSARTPARGRCRFYRHAAEAERDGFRACFICRPELAPGAGTGDRPEALAALAAATIAEGTSDLDDVARGLGVSARHLRRVVVAAVGVTPIELRQSKRIALAKQLLCDTRLPITEVAYASGFASVRRFNAVFRARFGRSPTDARRGRGPAERGDGSRIRLRLEYRPPYDWGAILEFLRERAIPGVEAVEGSIYRRTIALGAERGWIAVEPERGALACEVSLSLASVLLPLVARVRALFDLDAHPVAIGEVLGRTARFAPLVRRAPGLRVPGAVSGFELAVRAVLGQQVSVAGARTLAGKLAARFGEPLATPFPTLERTFPEPAALANARITLVPRTRARAIRELARAVVAGRLDLERTLDVEATKATLVALPGIGPWTAEYVAMRALRWPDAFPAGDLVLRRALGDDPVAAVEPVRPWRAYAVMHLWRNHADTEDAARRRRS